MGRFLEVGVGLLSKQRHMLGVCVRGRGGMKPVVKDGETPPHLDTGIEQEGGCRVNEP